MSRSSVEGTTLLQFQPTSHVLWWADFPVLYTLLGANVSPRLDHAIASRNNSTLPDFQIYFRKVVCFWNRSGIVKLRFGSGRNMLTLPTAFRGQPAAVPKSC